MSAIPVCLLGILLFLLHAAPLQAALWDRGGGLIYDDVLDITWLEDANFAKSSGYDSDGRMNLAEALDWADTLSYQGYDDWRLPDCMNFDGSRPLNGWDQDTNEMGWMFYRNLDNEATRNVSDLSGLTEVGPFMNLEPFAYWSITPYSDLGWLWWYFNFGSGLQWDAVVSTTAYAWAVRDGDSTPVPSPGSLWFLLSGLSAISIRRRGHGTVFRTVAGERSASL